MEGIVGRGPIRWRWGAAVALSVMILALYPQIHFWAIRRGEWNGSYAAIEGVGDEIAYSAYINALIDGRPRRNDPYTGRDFTSNAVRSDSLFSIQFVPAYLIALPARYLGLSAATAFILLTPLAAGATALALFWLLASVTGQGRIAAAGVVAILCWGTVVGGHGPFVSFFGKEPLYNYLMFLRRYQPAASFPFFILFCALVWIALTANRTRRALAASTLAAITFGLLVFSYVYLWTAAMAWLACLAMLWVLARPAYWREGLKYLAIIGIGVLAAVACFAFLYSNRATSLDSVQALEFSQAADLFRVPELIGVVVLMVLGYFAKKRLISLCHSGTLFCISFAFLPLIVFNQQVLTGRSLQPLHYEMFVANYAVLIAVVLAGAEILKKRQRLRVRIPRRALFWIALAAFEWGAYETLVATRGSMSLDRELDDARPVAMRLSELAKPDPRKWTTATLLSTDLLVADSLPTGAPQSVLWAPHMLVFSGATDAESKERFFQYLYYTGVSAADLKRILTTEERYGFAVGLFGFERTIRGLSRNPKPITEQDLEAELRNYADYCSAFSSERARKIEISFVVAKAEEKPDLSNLDRWYQRDDGEQVGKFILYRTRLRENFADGQIGKSVPPIIND